MVGSVEVEKGHTRLEDVRKSQEQYVKDVNSLTDRPDYDHFVDTCWHHMEMGSALQKDTLILVKGFFRFPPQSDDEASDLLDLIIENLQEGHYLMFAIDSGAGFALAALPNSMRIHWKKVRAALLKAVSDGRR